MFEYQKDIHARLSKDRRRVNTTFARVHTLTCHTVHVLRSLRIKHTSHRSRIPRSAPRHPRHCRRSSTACARSARRARQRWLRAGTCTVTPPPCCATASTQALDRPTNDREARRRRPTHAPCRPPVPRAHCREPWPLAAPAAPCCRALTPAHCPRCPLPAAPVPPARATAAKMKVLAATTAAAETWFAHGTASARDMQGTRDTRHARGRPRMHGRRSAQRGAAPAGHNADRVDLDTLDLVDDVGGRCAPAGLEEDIEGRLRSAPHEQAAREACGSAQSEQGRAAGGAWTTCGGEAGCAVAMSPPPTDGGSLSRKHGRCAVLGEREGALVRGGEGAHA